MTIRRLIYLFIATACLLLQTACQFEDDGQCADTINVGDSYISLTVAVSNGDTHARTRANTPAGGEDGDGREAGFERENTVTGITLILYQDANGINTTGNPTLDLVRYFPVTERAAGESPIEVTYTTGSQPLGRHNLNLSATYHAIVIANAPGVAASLTEGVSTLSDIKDATLNAIYAGDPTNSADDCTHFVMSSESDCTINFGSVIAKNLDGTAHTKGQDMLYDLTDTPIIIERMAARIDFWSKGATYDGTTYPTPGYVYQPWKSTDTTEPTSLDRFVVTRITPFNLNAGTEYLLKRTNDANKYLASETGSNYVIDPITSAKTGTSTPATFVNALSGIASSTDLSANDYCHTIAAMHSLASASSTIDGKENIIICYPMENTLPDASPLYYYATGIVIEGDYYTGNDVSQKEHRVYFGYIRHQGESAEAYDALLPSELSTTTVTSDEKPMNFGIVRNNIYRISIEKVLEKTIEAPKLTLKIKVKKWDKFEHAPIYM